MSRRRYISTQISLDAMVDKLAQEYGDFAALLYTWMIPHAEDNATVTGDPDELMFTVIPRRRDKTIADIIAALEGMQKLDLIKWDRDNKLIYFPIESFYRYQSYIREEKRRKELPSAQRRPTPPNAADQRQVAQNSVSPSPSPSPSPKEIQDNNSSIDEFAADAASEFLEQEKLNNSPYQPSPEEEVIKHYNAKFKGIWKRPLKLTPDRRQKIKARLKTYSVADICQAIDNIRASPYHCGENPNKQIYATPEFICRNDGMIDKWLNMPVNQQKQEELDLVEAYYADRKRAATELRG